MATTVSFKTSYNIAKSLYGHLMKDEEKKNLNQLVLLFSYALHFQVKGKKKNVLK